MTLFYTPPAFVPTLQQQQQPEDSPSVLEGFLNQVNGVGVVDDEPAGVQGSYSTEAFASYDYLTNWLTDNIGITKTQANHYVNDMAFEFRVGVGRWPAPAEMLSSERFLEGAVRFRTTLDSLPPLFRTESGFFANSGLTLRQLPGLGSELPDPEEARLLLLNLGDEELAIPELEELLNRAARRTQPDVPFVPMQFVQQLVGQGLFASGGGRGGGGGGGRAAPFTLDRDAVIERIREEWRSLLLEEPDNIGGLADQYISAAKSFRHRGGALDLGTWTRGKVRDTSRYQMLYRKKPESLSEDQYIGQYSGVVRQFGFNEAATTREIEAGLTSGAGLTGFTERVANVREASLQTPFTQRMVNAVGRLGPLLAS